MALILMVVVACLTACQCLVKNCHSMHHFRILIMCSSTIIKFKLIMKYVLQHVPKYTSNVVLFSPVDMYSCELTKWLYKNTFCSLCSLCCQLKLYSNNFPWYQLYHLLTAVVHMSIQHQFINCT